MADVVLSYAREDQPRAESLAHALEQSGWDVWWDRAILPGTGFEQVIETELRNARCVVVLWSAAARQSSWVRDEASLALSRNVLVPVRLDDAEPPLGFRQQQVANLAHWNGSTADPAFTLLTQGIARVVAGGAPASGPRRRVAAPSTAAQTRSTRMATAALAVGVLVAVGGALWAGGFLPARSVPGDDGPAASRDGTAAADPSSAVLVPAQATVTLPREQVRVTVLSGTLERLNADTRSLRLHVRFANDGTRSFYRTYYSSLRLLVDGVPHAPDNPPLEQVDASSVGEFDYRFDVPATATRGVLRVTHDDQMGEVALGFGRPGR